jgi:hypothetical protein
VVSGEELPSPSICSKNVIPFSEGCGTGIRSSRGFDLIAEFRFGYTILCLFFAEKPVTQTQQKYQST